MTDLSMYAQYIKLTDTLIAQATKGQIAECARLLAINVAHYQMTFGELPLEGTLAMLDTDKPNDDQVLMLTNGLECLVGVLGTVCSGLGEQKH